MTPTRYLQRIRAVLADDRDAWSISHINLSTGKVDDADVREHLAELDTLIAYLDNTIAQAESEAQHV